MYIKQPLHRRFYNPPASFHSATSFTQGGLWGSLGDGAWIALFTEEGGIGVSQ